MEGLNEDHVAILQKQIEAVQVELAALADDSDLKELLSIIHFPGYTTPAEFLFHRAVLDSMLSQVQGLAALKRALLEGGRAIAGASQ